MNGTAETGAAFAFPVIKSLLPKANFLVIQRDPMEVYKSLGAQGFAIDQNDFAKRVWDLYALSAQGVRTVPYADLSLESCCRWIWQFCLDWPWDHEWWEYWNARNLQVTMGQRKKELLSGDARVVELKREVEEYGRATRH